MSKKISSKQGVRYDRVGLELLWRKKNRNALLQLGSDDHARRNIAKTLNVELVEIESVLSRFDLERIVGVGPKFASYLQVTGVHGIQVLSARKGKVLYLNLRALKTRTSGIHRVPSLRQCNDFIEQANHLPVLITF